MSGIHERTGNAEPAMLAAEPGGATERETHNQPFQRRLPSVASSSYTMGKRVFSTLMQVVHISKAILLGKGFCFFFFISLFFSF